MVGMVSVSTAERWTSKGLLAYPQFPRATNSITKSGAHPLIGGDGDITVQAQRFRWTHDWEHPTSRRRVVNVLVR